MLSAAVSFSALLLSQGPARQPTDSARAAKLVERAREEELKVFTEWRIGWLALRDLNSSGSRFWSLHCHFDEIGGDDARHLVHSRQSRKSMCPVWFQGGGTRADESTGIDNPLGDKARRRVRERRARVLQLLDSAASLAPGNSWVLGQRVRLSVDQ